MNSYRFLNELLNTRDTKITSSLFPETFSRSSTFSLNWLWSLGRDGGGFFFPSMHTWLMSCTLMGQFKKKCYIWVLVGFHRVGNDELWNFLHHCTPIPYIWKNCASWGKWCWHPTLCGSLLTNTCTSMNQTEVFTLKPSCNFPVLPPFRVMILNLV